MEHSYLQYASWRKRNAIEIILYVTLLTLLALPFDARAQEGSWGNTYVDGGGQMTLFGTHTFMKGTGTQPGIIKTARSVPNGVLNYGSAATYTGAADASHVDGYVGKYGTTAFTFPVGNGIKLRPVAISAPTSGSFKAAYWSVNPNTAMLPTGAPFLLANMGTGVTAVSNVEYWDIDGPTSVNVTLSWDAASALNTLAAGNIANLVVLGYSNSTNKWESLGSAGGTTGTLSTTGTITANGITPDNYRAFTFGIATVGTPDLTPTIEATLSILAVGASSDITVYIENIKSTPTGSSVTVTITKPTASSGLDLIINPSGDWTVSSNVTQITLTLVGSIAGNDVKMFTGKLTRTGGLQGTYNFTPVIANNSGGETNNLNNRYSVVFTKN